MAQGNRTILLRSAHPLAHRDVFLFPALLREFPGAHLRPSPQSFGMDSFLLIPSFIDRPAQPL